MDSPLFLDQLRRPEPRALPRDRLEQRVLSSDAAPIALLLGPAGSGKTTLLSRIAARSTIPVAWYRASEDDADETAFARHLVCAVRLALGQRDDRPAAGRGPQSLASLVELLRSLGRRVSLVLDDLHEIAGTAAEHALARLVAHRPEHVRLFLASRRAPSINTSRLLVSGQLVQIESEDLRFRSWEVEELFRAVYGAPLSPESAAALTRRTGGWAAGLQLFHLSTVGMPRGERERAVDRLSGRSRLIRSYLTGNVLEGVADDRRDFLLRTSTLGVLSGPLCDALLETVGSAAVLNELEQQQFFTTSDDGGLTFRYHQVLQTHLEVVLVDELGVDRARALYLRSAALLEHSAGPSAAVRAYVHAEDWGAVARLLRHTASALPEDDPLWLAHALTNLPADDPTLIRAGARQLMRKGSVAQAVAAFGKAADLMEDPEARRRCATECARARVWLPDSLVLGDPPPADRLLRLSHELRLATRTGRDPRRATFALARGLSSLLAGDLESAGHAFRRVRHDAGAGDAEQLAARLGALVAGSVFSTPAALAEEFELLLADVEATDQRWLSRLIRSWRSAYLLVAEPQPWRSAACADLLDDCERDEDHWGVCLVSLALGAAQLALGQVDQAEAALNRARATAGELGAPVLALWAVALSPVSTPDRILRNADPTADPAGEPATDEPPDASPAETAAQLGVSWSVLRGRARQSAALSPLALATSSPSRLPRPRITIAPVPAPPAPPVPLAPVPVEPTVRLSCLGGFELSTDHQVVDSRQLRPRARSLLMMLALHHGQSIHREQLVEALWPTATLVSGVRTLQVAVSSIRSCLASAGLPDDSLRRYGTAYALHLSEAYDQLAEFSQQARAAERILTATDPRLALDLRLAALELYVGDLLPEVGPAEWVVGERDRLRQLAAALGSGAADLAGGLGELELGIRAARRSLELVPFQDHAWLQLAHLQERLGDSSAAQLTRREHRRVCADLQRAEPPPVPGSRSSTSRGHQRAAPVRSRSPARRGS